MTIHIDILVPELAESVSEATVFEWKKEPGDKVSLGETILEIETDKVVMDVPATHEGVLENLLKNTGETVVAGDVLGTIAASKISDNPDEGVAPEPSRDEHSDTLSNADAEQMESEKSSEMGVVNKVQEKLATPVALRLAKSLGVDMSEVEGTGPDGKILRRDVERVTGISGDVATSQSDESSLQGGDLDRGTETALVADASSDASEDVVNAPDYVEAKTALTAETSSDVSENIVDAPNYVEAGSTVESDRVINRKSSDDTRRVRLTRRQLTMAQRLAEVQREAVMTTTYNEVDMTQIFLMRSQYGEEFEKHYGVRLGLLSFFVKAAVVALNEFPIFNAELQETEILYYSRKHVGIAVATDDGLVVPVLRDVEIKSFAEIESEVRTIAAKARKKTLSIEDLLGGTFTITNGGVFGSLFSTPILNPPQTGILGMHAVGKRPVVVDDEVVVRPMMYLALTYDHRIVEGAIAVQFLKRVCSSIENPSRMMIGI